VHGCERFAIYGPHGFCWKHWDRWRRHGSPLKGRAFRGEPLRYFREVVLLFGGDNCLSWPYSRNKQGYGILRTEEGSTRLVHRLACEAVHGSPPFPRAVAGHSCHAGQFGCVNPQHVSWMTQGDNIAMSRAAGRM
jgi:hypothetical protein